MATIVDPAVNALAWDAGEGGGPVESYDVLLNGEIVGTLPASQTTFPLAGLALVPGVTYHMNVIANNAAGSASSDLIYIAMEALKAPAKPMNIRII